MELQGYPILMKFPFQIKAFDKNSLLFNLIFSLIIAGIITSIDIFLAGSAINVGQSFVLFLRNTVFSMIGFFLFGYPIIALIIQVNQRYPWSSDWPRRVLLDLVIILMISLLAAMVFSWVASQLNSVENNIPYYNTLGRYFAFSLIACLTFILVVESIVFFNEREQIVLKNEKLRREVLESKIQALRNQINPHFLFNSLNVLSSLVYKDPKLADRFILEFSKVYRYSLDVQYENLIPLSKELDFLESYIYLLHHRFQDNLVVHQNIDKDALDKKLPPMTLQLLLENVIKHNAFDHKDPLEVFLTADKKAISMENCIKVRKEQLPKSGIGLQNIIDRYSLISDILPEIERTETSFKVTVPLLNRETDA